jgi:transcriptional regulator with XRE-family HTH domain
MPTAQFENYLRTYRKKAGLTQQEVAALLGCREGAQVSRYEKRKRLPPLDTALACEAIFGTPTSQLFAGIREAIDKDVEKRLLELRSKLQTRSDSGSKGSATAQKLRWLASRVGSHAESHNALSS